MDEQPQDSLDEEWRQLCYELEWAREESLKAAALIPTAGDAAPTKSGDVTDANEALRDSIEKSLRKVEILRRMRLFIERLDQ